MSVVQELSSLGVRLYDDDGTARSLYAVIEDLARIWGSIDYYDSSMTDSSIDDRSDEEFMEAFMELMVVNSG